MPDRSAPITSPEATRLAYAGTLNALWPGLSHAEQTARINLMAMRDAANVASQRSRSEAVATLCEVHRLAAIYAMTPMKMGELFQLIVALERMMEAARWLERATR